MAETWDGVRCENFDLQYLSNEGELTGDFLEESRDENALGPIFHSRLVVELPLSAMHESKECMSQKLFDAILKNLSAAPGNSNLRGSLRSSKYFHFKFKTLMSERKECVGRHRFEIGNYMFSIIFIFIL